MDDFAKSSGMYTLGKFNLIKLSGLLAGKKEPLFWLA